MTPIESRVVEDFIARMGEAEAVSDEISEIMASAFTADRSPSASELARSIADHSGDRPA